MSDQESAAAADERVECGAGLERIIRWLVVVGLCLGFGIYSIWELYTGEQTVEKSASNYWFTVACAVILTPLGLVLLGIVGFMARRRLVADAEGLGYVGAEKVGWDQVTKLVARGKGLMDVHYTDEGEEDVLELDSYKLKGFDRLVQFIESKTEGKPVEQAKGD